MHTQSGDNPATQALGFSVFAIAGAYAGYAVGSVLALADPLILTMERSSDASAAEALRLMVDSVMVLVPSFLVLGILGGTGFYVVSRFSKVLYRGCLRCLPVLLTAVVYAYVGIRYLEGSTGIVDTIKGAMLSVVVGAPIYLVLRLLLLRLIQGRLWLPVGLAAVLSLLLWAPVVGWLVLR